MTVFPKNNLPTGSLNWSREVEKAVNNLESSFRSAEVNNVTRDAQLQNSYRRLDTALTQLTATNAAVDQAQADSIEALEKANEAIADIIDLGAPGGPAINANNITGGTITGITVQTASAGTRSKLSGSNIEFFSSAYTSGASRVGYIQGDDAGDAGLYIISDQGEIALDATNITLSGDTTVTGELAVGGSFSPGSISTGAITSTSLGTGAITASSLAVGTSNVGSNFINAESVGGGFASFTGSVTGQSGVISNAALTRTQLSGGGTTGASITDGGNFVRTSSSQRYKTDIQPLQLDLADLYEVEPKTFKRIDEVEENPEQARVYPGFIAEELAGTSLDKFVFYSKDEQGNSRPEGIHYPELTAALLLAIKDLNARLTALEDRV
jgi:hypothetical protein